MISVNCSPTPSNSGSSTAAGSDLTAAAVSEGLVASDISGIGVVGGGVNVSVSCGGGDRSVPLLR